MILIELLLLLTTFFPIYHLFTALKKKKTVELITTKKHSFSILVPCYNESICIRKTIAALKKMDYENYEVVFINDGSTDSTSSILAEELSLSLYRMENSINYYQSLLYKNFYCIDKSNTGKALSLNKGIEFSSGEIIVTLDADSVLRPDCLTILNNTFSDQNVAAAGGAIHILQADNKEYLKKHSIFKRLLIKVQSIDYLKGFFIYKLSLSRQNALAIISGAFGAFRKNILKEVGGFRKSLGEDIDITVKIQKHIVNSGKRIAYLPQAACYTECPETLGDLFKQRIRWQKGFVDCLVYHSKFLLSTCFNTPVSFYVVFEALCIGIFSCLLPVLTAIALVMTGRIEAVCYIYILCKVVNVFYSLFAHLISSRYRYPYKSRFFSAILLDIFLLKPFLSFVYLLGTVSYLMNKTEWQKTKRSALLAKS